MIMNNHPREDPGFKMGIGPPYPKLRRGPIKGERYYCDRIRVTVDTILYGDYATRSTWLRCA